MKSSASAPTLHTAELQESRTKREPLAPEHPEGPYLGESQSLGKYQNFANSAHMCNGLVRVSSGAAPKLDWQLNLRNGLHQNEFKTKWRRHYARPHQPEAKIPEIRSLGVRPSFGVPRVVHFSALQCTPPDLHGVQKDMCFVERIFCFIR
ncbi:Uncharacterized protein SCF082_LOCUS50306 [Durusdinium trenchii]|uniref:Uncharacterized protein n=1 Tax=Durusdinium trenchii TaxID=1381693 RepID=A0ABP0S711_9DINO